MEVQVNIEEKSIEEIESKAEEIKEAVQKVHILIQELRDMDIKINLS